MGCKHGIEGPCTRCEQGARIYTKADLDAAVAAERERCAKLVETQDTHGDYGVRAWFDLLAAKIRA